MNFVIIVKNELELEEAINVFLLVPGVFIVFE